MKYRKIAKEINELAKKDQDFRKSIFSKPNLTTTDYEKLNNFDVKLVNKLNELIDKIIAPTFQNLGKKASQNMWLLVQHSPDVKLQKKYLKILKQNKNEINISNIAYLEDKLLKRANKPQKFGTQLILDDTTNKYIPYKIINPKSVEIRRKRYNLEPLNEYIEFSNEVLGK